MVTDCRVQSTRESHSACSKALVGKSGHSLKKTSFALVVHSQPLIIRRFSFPATVSINNEQSNKYITRLANNPPLDRIIALLRFFSLVFRVHSHAIKALNITKAADTNPMAGGQGGCNEASDAKSGNAAKAAPIPRTLTRDVRYFSIVFSPPKMNYPW